MKLWTVGFISIGTRNRVLNPSWRRFTEQCVLASLVYLSLKTLKRQLKNASILYIYTSESEPLKKAAGETGAAWAEHEPSMNVTFRTQAAEH